VACKTVKILAVHPSPSRPQTGADLTDCFGWGLPFLMAGELNAKHMECNYRMTTRWRKFLRDYADDNSCLIFWPDTTTTNPYKPSLTPDVFGIVLTQKLSFSVY
jgi:hypothetical protein